MPGLFLVVIQDQPPHILATFHLEDWVPVTYIDVQLSWTLSWSVIHMSHCCVNVIWLTSYNPWLIIYPYQQYLWKWRCVWPWAAPICCVFLAHCRSRGLSHQEFDSIINMGFCCNSFPGHQITTAQLPCHVQNCVVITSWQYVWMENHLVMESELCWRTG